MCLMSVYAKKMRVIDSIDKRIKEKLYMKPLILDMRVSYEQIL
jgi:hypothetical protein